MKKRLSVRKLSFEEKKATPQPLLPLPGTSDDPRYPDQDGRSLADTDYHNLAIRWLCEALDQFFATVADVYVATRLALYFLQGERIRSRDPDVLVARGVGKHRRRSYRLPEEGVVPCTLFKIASEPTWRSDLGFRRHLYARLRVPEYFVFDPEAVYLNPPLRGFRLENNVHVPLTPAADGSLTSLELGLRLLPEGGMLRLYDLRTGRPIPTLLERIQQSESRVHQAKGRADRAKRRAALAKRLADLEEERARLEKQRANLEELRADLEELRADLTTHLAEVEVELEQLRKRRN